MAELSHAGHLARLGETIRRVQPGLGDIFPFPRLLISHLSPS
jgi:hypothetical protein